MRGAGGRFLSDLSRVLDVFGARLPRPWIALGHSMGGALNLLSLTQDEDLFDGAVLTAPLLGLRLSGRSPPFIAAVTAVMTVFGQAGRTTPPASAHPADEGRKAGRDGSVLTHDRARWAAYEALLKQAPELATGDQTWGWLQFAFILVGRLRAPGVLERVQAPVVILGAERDLLVTNAPQPVAAARLPNGRYVEVEGAFHEIMLETDARRAVFWREFDALAERVGAYYRRAMTMTCRRRNGVNINGLGK